MSEPAPRCRAGRRKGNPANPEFLSHRLLPSAAQEIRAVTFDVGGTLIEPWPSVGHIYAETAAEHGWKGLSAKALNRQFVKAWQALKNFNYTRAEWAELVDATFRGLIEAPPSRTLFSELYDRFSEPESWRVFDDVRPALDALTARGFKLGAISNWDRRLPPLLRRLGLHGYFEAVVVSCDVGSAKPSRIIFEWASAKLALPPEAILHVGDSPEMDVRGAQAAGMPALLLRRRAKAAKGDQIRSLRDLC